MISVSYPASICSSYLASTSYLATTSNLALPPWSSRNNMAMASKHLQARCFGCECWLWIALHPFGSPWMLCGSSGRC